MLNHPFRFFLIDLRRRYSVRIVCQRDDKMSSASIHDVDRKERWGNGNRCTHFFGGEGESFAFVSFGRITRAYVMSPRLESLRVGGDDMIPVLTCRPDRSCNMPRALLTLSLSLSWQHGMDCDVEWRLWKWNHQNGRILSHLLILTVHTRWWLEDLS